MQDDGRCGAKNRDGSRCRNYPVNGAKRCRMHGGSLPHVRRAATRTLAHQTAQRMVAKLGVDRDPIDHLLDQLHLSAALVAVYGQMVADLDNAAEVDLQDRPGGLRGEIWWEVIDTGLTKTDGDGKEVPVLRRVPNADRLLTFNREGLAKMHPFVDEYHAAIERTAKLAKLAIDAGVAERQVRVAERQGRLIADAVRGMLADAGVDMSRRDVPGIIRRHLQLVADNARAVTDVDAG